MSWSWHAEQKALDTRDRLLTVIDDRRRTARYSEPEPDTRPICEHCGCHADFSEHHGVSRQQLDYPAIPYEMQEQTWWECDWCGAPTEQDPYQGKDKKPMQSVGAFRALLDTGTERS